MQIPQTIFRIQHSDIFVKYEKRFDMKTDKLIHDMHEPIRNREDKKPHISVTFQKKNGNFGGKIRPENTDSTRLEEISLMIITYFGVIQYYIHLDMKLNYTISRIFQELLLSELQILQSLKLAVLKIPCE